MKSLFWISFFLFISFGNFYNGKVLSDVPSSSVDIRQVLHDLEENMGRIESIHAKFIQKKKMKIFKHVIELSGSFYMQKPDRVAWHTHSPIEHSIVFKDNKVHQWNRETNHVDITSLKDAPVLRSVIEQMQTWFYSSYVSLLDEHEVDILSKEPLKINFIPQKDSFYAKMIEHVVIQFNHEQSTIDSIEINEKSGDKSVFFFTETLLNNEIDPSVWNVQRRTQ